MAYLSQSLQGNNLIPFVSAYDDEGVRSIDISAQQRIDNVEQIIRRFFVGYGQHGNMAREALIRSISAGPGFELSLLDEEAMGGVEFASELMEPSDMVERAFCEYARSELGAVALARLLAWDDHFIEKGWRDKYGALTEAGITAYGKGLWRPFRVASNGNGSDAVTPSGALLLPDLFCEGNYSTGDLSNPLAIIHHELKAHVLPLKEGKGLAPGRKMELICIRLESEMLNELGLPGRRLNWGMDDGTIDHTLHEASERYYHGLVRYDHAGNLVEVDPDTKRTIQAAVLKN